LPDSTVRKAAPVEESVDQIQAAIQIVAGSITQIRVHERLLSAAGDRLDRAGSALLYKLHVYGDALRVTDLADRLGVDAPTVTRKIQQLEREQLVSRRPDPDDGRATRIMLTRAGRRAIEKVSIEKVLEARREWYERLVADWNEDDLANFASLLVRFSANLARDLDEARDD
jgi:DNA-binding MarR family transcriptional regulator